MVVDIILLLILAACVVWGFMRGGIEDILGLGALVVAFVASAPLGQPLGSVLGSNFGWSPGVSYLVARIVAGFCIYIPLLILASYIDRRLGRSEQGIPHPWNRVLGFVWGLGSGLVLFFLLLFSMDVALKVFPDASGWIVRQARQSRLRQWASSINPADRYLVTDVLKFYRVRRQDPTVVQRLREEPEVQKLLENPAFKRLLDDKAVAEAVRQRNLGAVLTNENFRLVLQDRDLRAQILSPAMHQAFERAMEKPSSPTSGSEPVAAPPSAAPPSAAVPEQVKPAAPEKPPAPAPQRRAPPQRRAAPGRASRAVPM